MIARLRGRVVEREGSRGILDVSGVGYEVFAPTRTLQGWSAASEPVTVHVSTQVREDAITLFGFESDTERKAFLVLLTVSGFGPKMALAALDALPVGDLAAAVEGDDLTTLGRIPGVGAKKAQRLALELKGKLPVTFDVARPARPVVADPLPLALARLDYGKSEIDKALAALEQRGLTVNTPLEGRLQEALRVLSGAR